jgi:hypothetical protein
MSTALVVAWMPPLGFLLFRDRGDPLEQKRDQSSRFNRINRGKNSRVCQHRHSPLDRGCCPSSSIRYNIFGCNVFENRIQSRSNAK